MFRHANHGDLEKIIEITKKNQKIMNEVDKIGQWDDGYPNIEVFQKDLENEQLYVFEDGEVVGFIVLNNDEYQQYSDINWISSEPCLVIHRFAVDPNAQAKGYGSKLLQSCISTAKQLGIYYLKIDTSSLNNKMNGVILKNGFTLRGTMNLKGSEFPVWNCYDLVIEKNS